MLNKTDEVIKVVTLGDMIKDYRKKHNDMTMDEFAERSGLSKGYISMLEQNKNPRTGKPIIPSITTFRRVAKAMGEELTDVMRAVDGRQKVSLVSESALLETNALYEVHPKKQIPILGRISAGLPLLAVEHIEDYENVEDESLDYGLIVKGNSMIGARIFEDDVVYVSRDCCIENGDIVIALINGDDATIKRFYKYDNEIILKPENPTMKEQHYKPEEVQLLGKVKQVKFNL
ncbi:MAG TPA: S24 family peptidase [Bacillota bacterium]|nr:S24 family peptidase [Bacillota bacterium]